MKIELWLIGDNTPKYIDDGVKEFEKRIKKYLPFEIKVFKNLKNAASWPISQVKAKEWEMISKNINSSDHLILLDDKGSKFTSLQFAEQLNHWMSHVQTKVIFLIGGAFGFDENAYLTARQKLSLSSLTFSHQLARIVLLEQIYRGLSILNNEPYHNE